MRFGFIAIIVGGIVWATVTGALYYFMPEAFIRKSLLAIVAMFFGAFLKEAFNDIRIIRRNKKSQAKKDQDD